MRITTVTIGRTKNLGNFNSAKCEVTVEVTEDEDPIDAARLGKNFVMEQLGEEPKFHAPRVHAPVTKDPDGQDSHEDPPPSVPRLRKRSGKKPPQDPQGDEPEAYGGSPT